MAKAVTMPRMRSRYEESIKAHMTEKFGYTNQMQVPKLDKIVINVGAGDAVADKKKITKVLAEISKISGQKPVATISRKSIAGFKLREEMPIGVKVTLRSTRMYEFLDRLVNFTIPRIRDFRGLSPKAFDGQGNYNMGMTEQIAFPEIDYDSIDTTRGMDITIVNTARTDAEGRALLDAFGFPFRRILARSFESRGALLEILS